MFTVSFGDGTEKQFKTEEEFDDWKINETIKEFEFEENKHKRSIDRIKELVNIIIAIDNINIDLESHYEFEGIPIENEFYHFHPYINIKSNGAIHKITFMDYIIWESEDDERVSNLIHDLSNKNIDIDKISDDEFWEKIEPIENFLRKKIDKYIKNIKDKMPKFIKLDRVSKKNLYHD